MEPLDLAHRTKRLFLCLIPCWSWEARSSPPGGSCTHSAAREKWQQLCGCSSQLPDPLPALLPLAGSCTRFQWEARKSGTSKASSCCHAAKATRPTLDGLEPVVLTCGLKMFGVGRASLVLCCSLATWRSASREKQQQRPGPSASLPQTQTGSFQPTAGKFC